METTTLEREVAQAESAPESEVLDRPKSGRWKNDHSVNIRVSIPLPAGRWYISLVSGRERRSADRRRDERRKHPLITSANLIFVLIVGLFLGGAFWLAVQSLLLWILSIING